MRWGAALLGLMAAGNAFAQTPERIFPGFLDLPVLTGDSLVAQMSREDWVFVETPAHAGKATEARADAYIAALQAKNWRRVESRRGRVFRHDGGAMCIDVQAAITVGVDAAAAEQPRSGVTFHRRACPTSENPN